MLTNDQDACPPAFLSTLRGFFTDECYACELTCTTPWMVLIYVLVNQEKEKKSCIAAINLNRYDDLLATSLPTGDYTTQFSNKIYKLNLLQRIYKSTRFPNLTALAVTVTGKGAKPAQNEEDVLRQMLVRSYEPLNDDLPQDGDDDDILDGRRQLFGNYFANLPFLRPGKNPNALTYDQWKKQEVGGSSDLTGNVLEGGYDKKTGAWYTWNPAIAQKIKSLTLRNFNKARPRALNTAFETLLDEGKFCLEELTLEYESLTNKDLAQLLAPKLSPRLKALSLDNTRFVSLEAFRTKAFTSLTSLLLNNINFEHLHLLQSAHFPQLRTLRLQSCFKEQTSYSEGSEAIVKNNSMKLGRLVSGNTSFCEQITSLDITDNILDKKNFDTIFTSFRNLTSLNLSLSRELSAAALEKIKILTNLASLTLSETGWEIDEGQGGGRQVVVDSVLEKLLPLKATLTSLVLKDCVAITDAGLAHVGALEKLERLELTEARKVTEEGLWQMLTTLLPRLEVLNLEGCQKLGDLTLRHIASPRLLLPRTATTNPRLLPLQSLNIQGWGSVSGAGLNNLARHLEDRLRRLTTLLVDCSAPKIKASNLRPFRLRGIRLQ